MGCSDQKIPTFTVPRFDGSTLECEECVNSVEHTFKDNGQLQYLEDEKYYNDRLSWSKAFSSRILDSLTGSNILGYMLNEVKDEDFVVVRWMNSYCST